jgi:hypothetical protein
MNGIKTHTIIIAATLALTSWTVKAIVEVPVDEMFKKCGKGISKL